MRILVTGSRDWCDDRVIYEALKEARGGTSHYQIHPADWIRYGKAAGPIRNGEMVDLGADICLAFLGSCSSSGCKQTRPHTSHGTTDCANYAESKGIPVKRFLA